MGYAEKIKINSRVYKGPMIIVGGMLEMKLLINGPESSHWV